VIAYPNACVLRTFSKAFGLASIRLGYMIAHENITSWINRVRSPYHVNQLSQWIGSVALDQRESVMNHIRLVIIERERLYREFIKLGLPVETSQGNFLYIQPSTYHLNDELKRRGIIIREWPNGSSRITVGQPHENDQLINALKEIIQ
jgi:histidinol-phosphate aminotransferase